MDTFYLMLNEHYLELNKISASITIFRIQGRMAVECACNRHSWN